MNCPPVPARQAVPGKLLSGVFADVKRSMALPANRDPEEARKILDPVLELIMEAVHRHEGTVNQIGGKMRLFQWHDGKKVIVWPEELATGKPRFPTPLWSRR